MGILQNENAIPTAVAGGFYDHQIDNSARFDSTSVSYLSKTFSSAGNLRKYTWSVWFKLTLGANNTFPMFWSQTGYSQFYHHQTTFRLDQYHTNSHFISPSMLFRDTGGWYHFVSIWDSDNSTEADRIQCWINGVRITDMNSTGYPSVGTDSLFNKASTQYIGYRVTNSFPFDGYMAEIVFLDGAVTSPVDTLGEFKNGIWIPKDPSGLTFGSNGYYLKFENASDLGNDSSGNNNDFSTNGLGTDHQVLDSPTFGS